MLTRESEYARYWKNCMRILMELLSLNPGMDISQTPYNAPATKSNHLEARQVHFLKLYPLSKPEIK